MQRDSADPVLAWTSKSEVKSALLQRRRIACHGLSAPASQHALRTLVCLPAAVILLLGSLIGAPAARAAAVACTAGPGYANCVRYTYSGGGQSFTVPAGVVSIRVKLWGAGGAAGGGFVDAVIAVTPGEALTLSVGEGGKYATTTATYGGGGGGGSSTNSAIIGQSGGGLSGIWRGAAFALGNQLVIAGGGGGWSNGAAGGVFAGAGGGLSGLDDGQPIVSGQGGTPSAGGGAATVSTSCNLVPGSGSQFTGGAGGGTNTVPDEGGGGGGGGWFGGGGGRCQIPAGATGNGMGGGGSSFISGVGVSAASTVAGMNSGTLTPGAAAMITDAQYVAGVGSGSVTANGGNGLIVIQYNSIVPVADTGSGVAGIASTVTANVAANDTINGATPTLGAGGNATIATSGSWPTGISLNTANGAVSISTAVAAGTYNVVYQLCDTASPATCRTATDVITVKPSPLSITKAMTSNADQDGSGTINLNDTLTYKVTVTNSGAGSQLNVVISDDTITPNSKTCATVAAGATCVLTGTYKVTQADVDAAKITNTASAVSTAITTPVTTTLTTTVVRIAQLKITKTSNVPTGQTVPFAVPGSTVRYCVTTLNTGTATATGVVMTDNLPPQVTYVTGSMLSGTSCASAATHEDEDNVGADETDPAGMYISGTTIFGSITTLAPGASVAFVFDVKIN